MLEYKDQAEEWRVNALNGLFPFLREKVYSVDDIDTMCQRPKRAFSISTQPKYGTVGNYRNKCQRPKRAFSISTVPSKTPHKHWLSSPVFAGICLNILIITVF